VKRFEHYIKFIEQDYTDYHTTPFFYCITTCTPRVARLKPGTQQRAGTCHDKTRALNAGQEPAKGWQEMMQ